MKQSSRLDELRHLVEFALVIVGAIATVFSCIFAYLAYVYPDKAREVAAQFVPTEEPRFVERTVIVTTTPQSFTTSEPIVVTRVVPFEVTRIVTFEVTKEVFSVVTETPQKPTDTINPSEPVILFEDNFDNGLSELWRRESGDPLITGGTLSAKNPNSGALIMSVGDNSWVNYEVEFSILKLGSFTQDLLGLRSNNNGGAVVLIVNNGNGLWGIMSSKGMEQFGSTRYQIKNLEHFSVKVQGNKFEAMGGTNYIDVDNKFPDGGIFIKLSSFTIDNFKVTKLP